MPKPQQPDLKISRSSISNGLSRTSIRERVAAGTVKSQDTTDNPADTRDSSDVMDVVAMVKRSVTVNNRDSRKLAKKVGPICPSKSKEHNYIGFDENKKLCHLNINRFVYKLDQLKCNLLCKPPK